MIASANGRSARGQEKVGAVPAPVRGETNDIPKISQKTEHGSFSLETLMFKELTENEK